MRSGVHLFPLKSDHDLCCSTSTVRHDARLLGDHFTSYPETHLKIMFSLSPKLLVTTYPAMSYPLMLTYCTQHGQTMTAHAAQLLGQQKPGVVI